MELLQELIDLFLDTTPRLVSDIKTGIEQRDPGAILHSAHALKGALLSIGANQAAHAALQLETIGQTGDMLQVDDSINALLREIDRLHAELRLIAEESQV